MKRLTMILAMIALTGCEKLPPPVHEDWPPAAKDGGIALMVIVDPLTGCQYLDHRNYYRALTPRIAADGKTHMGCKGTQP